MGNNGRDVSYRVIGWVDNDLGYLFYMCFVEGYYYGFYSLYRWYFLDRDVFRMMSCRDYFQCKIIDNSLFRYVLKINFFVIIILSIQFGGFQLLI